MNRTIQETGAGRGVSAACGRALHMMDKCAQAADSAPVRNDIVDTVSRFYDNIVLPTKMEFADGKYNGSRYHAGFVHEPKIVFDATDKNVGTGGYALEGESGPEAHITPAAARNTMYDPYSVHSVLVHELAHLQNLDARGHKGVTKSEKNKLHNAYGFTGKNIARAKGISGYHAYDSAENEEATTNRQYRFAIWNAMREQLGRDPTYAEFKDHIREMTGDDILKTYMRYPNKYVDTIPYVHGKAFSDAINSGMDYDSARGTAADAQNKSNEEWIRQNADNLRKAWLEVARNSSSVVNSNEHTRIMS